MREYNKDMAQAKTTEKFEELYTKLNPEQKAAVDTIEGPVMVVAGPGTGKTQVLTLRIAKILRETDIEPENILALTFTEAAAFEMRKRLAGIMGPLAYRVAIFTFHGFCNDIILQNPEEFPEIISSVNATEADQIRIAQKIVESTNFQYIKPYGDPLYYIKPLLKTVSELKREGIDTAHFQKLVETQQGKTEIKNKIWERQIGKNLELSEFYKKYQEALRVHKYYDYDDMILKVVQKLSGDKDFLVPLQEQYHYILADEHQDVNNAQNKVLKLLGSYDKNPNIFLVGDEKQAIFRFQGASLENFLYFQRTYPSVQLIRLKRNYRSPQSILDAASHLMGEENDSLVAEQARDGKVRVYEFSNPDVELYFLAESIKEKIAKGAYPRDIAVLFRDNKDAYPVVWILRKYGIPFVIESDQDVLSDEYIRKLIILFKAVQNFGEDEYLYPALHIDFVGIEPLDVYRLASRAHEQRKSIYNFLQLDFPFLYEKFAHWGRLAKNASVTEVYEEVARESGLLAAVLEEPDAFSRMEKLRRFFTEVRTLANVHHTHTLAEFLEHLAILEEQGISLQKGLSSARLQGVHLMTAHKAKGREFDYVYIINAMRGHWGNRRAIRNFALPESVRFFSSSERDDEEERKLFYVALTRARKEVAITYAIENAEGRQQMPSRFIEEIDPALRKAEDASLIEEDFARKQELVFAPALQTAQQNEEEFLRELLYERGLSMTSLNNYLECPWKYFYINLLRVPKAPNRHQLYGIAVHRALQDFFERYKRREEVSKKFLLSQFEYHLSRTGLLPKDFDATLERGRAALSGFMDAYYPSWERNIISELNIKGVFLDDIPLTGKLDKVEFVGAGRQVNVVDYKTGKPKSRNEIEGKTKNSLGNYKRQLVFYQLLMDGYKDGKYRMVSGELDFVEPNERGKYKKERFEITAQEVEELRELIRQVASEIATLAFWSRTCGNSKCEYCALRSMMRSPTKP